MSRYSSYTDRPYGALMFDELEEYHAFIAEMSAIIDSGLATAGVAVHNRAIAHWEIGEAGEALADFDQAIQLLPRDSMPNHAKAMLLEKLNRIELAIECAREAVRISPRAATSRRLLAQLLVSAGRLEEAVPQYKEAIRIEPSFARTKADLRDLQARIRDGQPSRSWWKLW